MEGHRQMGNHDPVRSVWPTLGGMRYTWDAMQGWNEEALLFEEQKA